MKTANYFDRDDTLRTARILDAVPAVGDKDANGSTIIGVEEETAYIESSDDAIRNGTVYEIRTEDENGSLWIYHALIPHDMTMTVDEYIQNLMDNDEENITHMTEEQAADILDWTRGDDEDHLIPDDLTASELARRWNEIRGTL